MFSLEKIIEKICEHTGIDEDKVKKMILEKQDELSGLVSEEGAAYIVARELGVNLIRETKRQLKIKNIIPGLRSVDLVARVVKIMEPREFERNGKSGKVLNVILGDETGTIRFSLWNEEIEVVESGKLKEGDTIKISGAYVKADHMDNPELRIGRGTIEKTDQIVDLPPAESIEKNFSTIKRCEIRDFREGKMCEVRATLVQAFRKSPFYEVCPQCGSRVTKKEDKWVCDDHGEVEPKHHVVLSGIIDDGTGNIRAVFFRDMAEKVFGKSLKELEEIAEKNKDTLSVFEHIEGLGKDFIFRGRVRKNTYSERMEFVVNEVQDVDVKKEIDSLLSELGSAQQ